MTGPPMVPPFCASTAEQVGMQLSRDRKMCEVLLTISFRIETSPLAECCGRDRKLLKLQNRLHLQSYSAR